MGPTTSGVTAGRSTTTRRATSEVARLPRTRRGARAGLPKRAAIRDEAASAVRREPPVVLLIDTANVVGSRPTGWWRDRAAATRRLAERVRAATAASRLPEPVVMVLEGMARRGVEEGVADGVTVVHAPGDGDDTLASLAATADAPVVLVSADRGLRARVRGSGAEVVAPSWLLDRLGG
jgi:hypothetical protein